jgi:hypothetical protein
MQLPLRSHFEFRIEPLEVGILIGPTALALVAARKGMSPVAHDAKRAAKGCFTVTKTYDEPGFYPSEKLSMHTPTGV